MMGISLIFSGCHSTKEGADESGMAGANKQMMVKGAAITWIKDMPGDTKHKADLFGSVPESILKELNLEQGIPSSMSCFFVKSAGKDILFDSGLGSGQSQLMKTLQQKGIKPADVKLIYLTHLHGDHIGGLLNDGHVVFPNAEVYLSKAEYEAWMTMDGRNEQQKKMLNAYEKHLHLFNFGEVLPGKVQTIDAVGHTPGHTAYQVGGVLIVGDLMHGAQLQMQHPEYCARYDMDQQKSVESRKRLIQYAKQNGLLMAGMHLPDPGFISFAPEK